MGEIITPSRWERKRQSTEKKSNAQEEHHGVDHWTWHLCKKNNINKSTRLYYLYCHEKKREKRKKKVKLNLNVLKTTLKKGVAKTITASGGKGGEVHDNRRKMNHMDIPFRIRGVGSFNEANTEKRNFEKNAPGRQLQGLPNGGSQSWGG